MGWDQQLSLLNTYSSLWMSMVRFGFLSVWFWQADAEATFSFTIRKAMDSHMWARTWWSFEFNIRPVSWSWFGKKKPWSNFLIRYRRFIVYCGAHETRDCEKITGNVAG